jgi:hypothetical protein
MHYESRQKIQSKKIRGIEGRSEAEDVTKQTSPETKDVLSKVFLI